MLLHPNNARHPMDILDIMISGLYDKVTELMRRENLEIVDLEGVEPNPRLATCLKGCELGDFK